MDPAKWRIVKRHGMWRVYTPGNCSRPMSFWDFADAVWSVNYHMRGGY